MLILCMLLQMINKVKATCQGQGHSKISTSFKFYVKFYLFSHIELFVCGCSSLIRSRSYMSQVIHDSQGHIKVKVKYLPPSNFM